jgi:capsular exopolysaccharide synthesis family protein
MQTGIVRLRHYGWVIRSRLPHILLGVIICTATAFAACKILPPVYQATGLILVNASLATDATSTVDNQNLAQTYSLAITPPDVLGMASQNLPHSTVEQLKIEVTAVHPVNTALIQVQAQANSPVLAANIVNKVCNAFVQYQTTKQTALLQNALNQLTQNITVAKTNLDAANAQLAALQKSHAPADAIQQQQPIVSVDQVNYTTLQTNYQANFSLLGMQMNQISNSFNVVVAVQPVTPISPKTAFSTSLAAALSLLLLIVFALLLDWVDTTVKTLEDVVRLTRLEPLGSVPICKYPHLFNASTDMSNTNNEDVQQAFVAIRTNFDVLAQERGIIQFTSLRAGTGTSTMAANLAVSLAMSGRRVLLVDANLRKPSLHTLFNRSNEQGLSNRLNDVYVLQEQRPDLIQSWLNLWATGVPNVWLLPAGPAMPHLASGVRSPNVALLLQTLLRQSQPAGNGEGVDIIILDTPPLNDGASAIALAAIADGIVLVIGAGKDRAESVLKAEATFQRLQTPIVGVIINRKEASHHSYIYFDHIQQNTDQVGNIPQDSVKKTSLRNTHAAAVPHMRSDLSPVLPAVQQPTPYPPEQEESFAPPSGQFVPKETNSQARLI